MDFRALSFTYIVGVALWLTGTPLGAGEISGRVLFEGKPRPARTIDMASDEYCVSCHDGDVTDERFVVGGREGDRYPLANIFVYVSKGVPEGDYAVPNTPVVVRRKGCLIVPRVVGIRVGQPIQFQNDDAIPLHLHAIARYSDAFSEEVSAGAQSTPYVFKTHEVMAKIKSSSHHWEKVYVGAVDHPFFAVTDQSGRFNFKGLPDGEYRVEAWQEILGSITATATIQGGSAQVEMVFTHGR